MLQPAVHIQLLEYPIPARPACQKPSSVDISETESGIIDPLAKGVKDVIKQARTSGRRAAT